MFNNFAAIKSCVLSEKRKLCLLDYGIGGAYWITALEFDGETLK